MCLNFTSIILIIQILRFSLGSQVQNLFSCANRGSKADYGRRPPLNRLENKKKKSPDWIIVFPLQHTMFRLPSAPVAILVKNGFFSLDPHNCRTWLTLWGVGRWWGGNLITNFSATLAERIQLEFFGAHVLPGQRAFGMLPR